MIRFGGIVLWIVKIQ